MAMKKYADKWNEKSRIKQESYRFVQEAEQEIDSTSLPMINIYQKKRQNHIAILPLLKN